MLLSTFIFGQLEKNQKISTNGKQKAHSIIKSKIINFLFFLSKKNDNCITFNLVIVICRDLGLQGDVELFENVFCWQQKRGNGPERRNGCGLKVVCVFRSGGIDGRVKQLELPQIIEHLFPLTLSHTHHPPKPSQTIFTALSVKCIMTVTFRLKTP